MVLRAHWGDEGGIKGLGGGIGLGLREGWWRMGGEKGWCGDDGLGRGVGREITQRC